MLVNHFIVCLDRSGSMASIAKKAVDAFNQNVRAIKDGAQQSGQASTVTLVTFGGDIRTHFECEAVANLRSYDYSEYKPTGGTPLFDAVAQAITKMKSRLDYGDKEVSYVVLVVTDGEENESRITPREFTAKLMEAQNTDRWSFAFLLPPGSTRSFCAKYGVPEGNVREWEATAKGVVEAAKAVDAGIGSYFTLRTAGAKSTRGFFTTDLSNVSETMIREKLTDVRGKVKLISVNRVEMIRPFVEKELGVSYVQGRALYQLTKEEKVQHHKQVMLRHRIDGAVYGGADARKLLGLPDGLDVKVKPGDHANWDVFVQSTSVNRKLVPGTTLLYTLS